jgi:hypothetical protein
MKLPKKYIIYDTEFTSWKGSQERNWNKPNEYRELVAIGALLINDLKIEKKFKILCKPRINNILSEYFINLTGISNEDIKKKGYDFEICLKKFLDFCGNNILYSYGNDFHIFDENINLYNLKNFNLNKKMFKDIRPYFDHNNINTKLYSSGSIYKSVNLRVSVDNIHDPLFDSLSIFKTIKYLEN